MKIQTKQFRAAFDQVAWLAKNRTASPILSCVLIATDGSRLSVSASNNEASATASCDCTDSIEPFCVSAATLKTVLHSAGDELAMEVVNGFLRTQSGVDRSSIPIEAASEFPILPKPDRKNLIGVNCEDLAGAIQQVHWAADISAITIDTWRAAVNVKTSAKEIVCTATESRTIAHVVCATIGADSEAMFSCQYAPSFADALTRENADYYVSENHIFAVSDSLILAVTRFIGKFVGYEPVLNRVRRVVGSIIPSVLSTKLSLCNSLHASLSKFPACLLDFSESGLKISSEGGGFESSMEGKFSDFKKHFDASRLHEVMKHFGNEPAKLSVDDFGMMISQGDLVVYTCSLNPLAKK